VQVQNTGEGSNLATSPKPRVLTAEQAEFYEILQAASPRIQSIIKALLILLRGKTLQGEPLTDTQRETVLSLVLTELESLRADGFPCEDVESILSKITKGGKS
jgi:hypothetical protein